MPELNQKPSDLQVGGSHYKDLKIQPTQLSYRLNASPSFKDIAKYITRNKLGTDKMEDLQKASHFIDLEEELIRIDNKYFWNNMWPNAHLHISTFSEQFPEDEQPYIFELLWAMYSARYADARKCMAGLILLHEKKTK